MEFICYERCSTCQKAKKYLIDKKIDFEIRDIKKCNPSKEELRQWYLKSNLELKNFFNTSGVRYQELNLKEKIKEMSEEEMLEILSKDGMLVKRPILVNGEQILIGFKREEWERINI